MPQFSCLAGPGSRTVLQVGPAMAVLIDVAPSSRPARDEIASAALRHATGLGDINIGRRPSGRPRLEPPYHELGVSLAARGGLLLVGFVRDRNVGVDLELDQQGDGFEPVRLARDHFASREADAIARLDRAAAKDLFLRLWVAKEAALKATGRGVADGLGWPDLSSDDNALRGATTRRVTDARGLVLELAQARLDRGAVGGGDGFVYCALAAAVEPAPVGPGGQR